MNATQAERSSDALAGWMVGRGAMTLAVELVVEADGSYKWCAAVVSDNHQPGFWRRLNALETSSEHPTVFGAIGELALDHTPLVDLTGDPADGMRGDDWGRLAADL